MNIQDLRDKLTGAKGDNRSFTAHCPSHEDKRSSLSVTLADDGKILLHCHAGCNTPDVLGALGLEMKHLSAPNGKAKIKPEILETYDYADADGNLLYQVVRFVPKKFRQRRPDPDKRGDWLWNLKGVKQTLFRLPELMAAIGTGETIFVVEGEKDCNALAAKGLAATTNSGGAAKWTKKFSAILSKAEHVAILPDNDAPGIKHAWHIAEQLQNAVVLMLPDLPDKGDVTDWFQAGGTAAELKAFAEDAFINPPQRPAKDNVLAFPANAEEQDDPTPKTAQEILSEECTDVANAYRFKGAYGDRVRHSTGLGWLWWNGKRWMRGEKQVRRWAQNVGDLVRKDATKQTDADIARSMFAFAKATERRAGIDNLLIEAAVLNGIDADSIEFDADPWLLNCENCTVDLRNGAFFGHQREHFITKIVPTNYDPKAECPKWLAAQRGIFEHDDPLLDYFQWMCGYSLSGNTKHQCFFILYGSGCNGKSTLIDVLQHTVGEDYSQQLDAEQLLVQKHQGHPTAMAALRGVRFLSAIETNEGRRLDESKIKGWTGGDRIRARFLFKDEFEFTPTFKLWLGTNHRPVIRDDSGGMWRRIRLIPFLHNFDEDPEKDKDLAGKLKAEAEGILAWAVRGAIRATEAEPELPEAVQAATNEYKSESDLLGQFIEEECTLSEYLRSGSTALFTAFKAYAGGHGGTQTAFGLRLKRRGFEAKRMADGKSGWLGIGLAAKDLEN